MWEKMSLLRVIFDEWFTYKEGTQYANFTLLGPDLQFAVTDNVGIGVITTWIGAPLLVSVKGSWSIAKNTQLAVGTLAGTASWINPELFIALPYTAISYGNRSGNIAFSVGYLATSQSGSGLPLLGLGAMSKLSSRTVLFLIPFGLQIVLRDLVLL